MLGLGFLVSIGKTLIGDWTAAREAKREVKKAVTENKIRLAQNEQTHNSKWEMMQLEDKDELLQRISFFLLSAPFVVAIFDPLAVRDYFTIALASVPDWYQWAYVSILGAIWGIAEFKKLKG